MFHSIPKSAAKVTIFICRLYNLAFDQLIDIYEDDVTKADDIPEAINIAEYWLVRVKSESEKKAINKILSALKKANEVGRRMDWVL